MLHAGRDHQTIAILQEQRGTALLLNPDLALKNQVHFVFEMLMELVGSQKTTKVSAIVVDLAQDGVSPGLGEFTRYLLNGDHLLCHRLLPGRSIKGYSRVSWAGWRPACSVTFCNASMSRGRVSAGSITSSI